MRASSVLEMYSFTNNGSSALASMKEPRSLWEAVRGTGKKRVMSRQIAVEKVNSKHSELTVFGFVRKHYRHSVPNEIVNLMESYYSSLWMKRRLSIEEMNELNALAPNQYHELPFGTFVINGKCIHLHLEYNFGFVSLAVILPPSIHFISGNFALINGSGSGDVKWTRAHSDSRIIRKPLSLIPLAPRFERELSAYLDITQIKMKGNESDDVGIKPNLKSNVTSHRSLDDLNHLIDGEPISR